MSLAVKICLLVFVLLAIIFIPWGVISALNILFPQNHIEFTFESWLAVVMLQVVFGKATVKMEKK